MDKQKYKRELCDGIIVCAGYSATNNVILYTASNRDAQWLYSAVKDISVTRDLDETDEQGLPRDYYLKLAEDDEHSIGDADSCDWGTNPVYQVTFEPTEYCQQRMLDWADEDVSLKAPTDFTLSPTIAELIFRAGAHIMPAEDGNYLEFDASNIQKLDAEFQNLGIRTTNVGEMWRLDSDNAQKFAEYAGVDIPEGGD